jgi:hypothetical protein
MIDNKNKIRCDREIGRPGKGWHSCNKLATIRVATPYLGGFLYFCPACWPLAKAANDKDSLTRGLEKYRWGAHTELPPQTKPIGDELVAGLRQFAEDLKSGEPLQDKYRITRVTRQDDGTFEHKEIGKKHE